MVHGAPDFTKVMRGETDEVWIKGVAFRDPSVAACKPISVENPALAYDLANDRFKVDIEAISLGVISADITDRAARLLGIIYGDQGQLAQRATTRDLLAQLRHGGAEIDPRDRTWTITEALNRGWTLGSGDQPAPDPRLYDLFTMLQRCDKYDLDYDAQGRLQYLKVYDGVTLKMTLTLTYDAEGRLDTIVRT